MKIIFQFVKIALLMGGVTGFESYGADETSWDDFTIIHDTSLRGSAPIRGENGALVEVKEGLSLGRKRSSSFEPRDYFMLPVESKGFSIPPYERLDWSSLGRVIQSGGLIQRGNLYYQVLLPQRFTFLEKSVNREEIAPDSFDKLSPQTVAQVFFKQIQGDHTFAYGVYGLNKGDQQKQVYIPVLFAKGLKQNELEIFHWFRDKITAEVLKCQGQEVFYPGTFTPTGALPSLTPQSLRTKLLTWLAYNTSFQLQPSVETYEHCQAEVPVFWRLSLRDEPGQDIIITSPVNDLLNESDTVLRAAQGNLTYLDAMYAIQREVKDLHKVKKMLMPFGLTKQGYLSGGANHWTLLSFEKKNMGWDVVNFDPKPYRGALGYDFSTVKTILQQVLTPCNSFASRSLGHQGIMNTTDCAYYVLTYLQFMVHGLSFGEVSREQITNQFPLWL